MSRSAHALQEARDRSRRTDLAHEVDAPDVDAEFERRRRDERREITGFEALLGQEPLFAGEAPVVGRDPPLAEPFAEFARHPLRHAPRVHEDERRPVGVHERGEPLMDLLPDLAGHDGLERRPGQLDGEIPSAHVPRIDDHAGAIRARQIPADEESRHALDRPLRRGQANSLDRFSRQCVQPRERKGQMRTPLVPDERVDFVDDDGTDGAEHAPPAFAREEDVERLGRRDHDMGRPRGHPRAIPARGVSAANHRADLDPGETQPLELARDAGEWHFEIPLDVVAERLERRDIEDPRLVPEGSGETVPHEFVEGGQERGEGFSRSGRCRDERALSGEDVRPAVPLRRRLRAELSLEPGADGRMERGE